MQPLDEAAEYLLTMKKKLEAKGWKELHLNMEVWDTLPTFYGKRLETDEELEARKRKKQKKKEQVKTKLEYERKLYKKLKQKFEKC
jgi:hypothetical protein